jgi:hypothetical protein
MLAYYAIYETTNRQGPAKGICVVDPRTGDALIWNHRNEEWEYNPELAGRLIFDLRSPGRTKEVDRPAAERIAVDLALRRPLPAEEEIQQLLLRKGATPPAG